MPWSQRIIAHLTLDSTRLAPMAAGHNALIEDFMEHLLAEGCLALRGE
jgi:hypothetical protein